ncbi:MAG: hypothetical protein C9356_15590 [Oleiphilus sp.]|nr:MAG: hypothetical protein C9356_15590 [Oleiphilus sp.]
MPGNAHPWLFLTLASLLSSAFGADASESGVSKTVAVERGEMSVNIGRGIAYRVDADNIWDAEDILELEGGWQVSDAETPNFGVDASAYWFQRTISVLDPDSSYLLEIACPALDDINLYFVRVKVVIGKYETGDRQVFSSRPYSAPGFPFSHT